MFAFAYRTEPAALLRAMLGVCVLTGAAFAQATPEQQSAIRSNCRSDFMSKCSGVTPGGAEALQCLQRNVARLSPGCQNAVNALAPAPAPVQQAAMPQTAVNPAAVLATPLAAAPSATASPAAKRPASSQQEVAQNCGADFMMHCQGVPAGGTEAMRCLQRNAAQLSPECARTLVTVEANPAAPAAAPRAAKPAAPKPAPAQAATAPAAAPTAEQRNAIKQSCQRDFMSKCSGVTPGGQEALSCLQRNAASLSPNCRNAVAALGGGAAPASAEATPAVMEAPRPPAGPFPLRRAIREKMMER